MTSMVRPAPETRESRRAMPLMPPRVRKIVLTLHVIISVGWLGVDFAMLTLGITGFGRSTAGLSFGLQARAGSTRTP